MNAFQRKIPISHITKQLSLTWLKQSDNIAEAALDFLKTHYLPNEPISKSIGLRNNPNDCQVIDRFFNNCLQSDSSVVVTNKQNGQLVGVFLSYVAKRKKTSKADYVDWSTQGLKPSVKHDIYIKTVENKLEEMNLFNKFPKAETIMEHMYGATHPDWLKAGVAKSAAEYVKDVIAPQLKCDILYALSTSSYSARLVQNLGYSEYWRINLDEIKDNRLENSFFNVEPPHKSIICSIFEVKHKQT